ncbi:MAG: hypothetical protein ACI4UU_04560 [Clostridia bacterium]
MESCLEKRYINISKLSEIVEMILISLGVFFTPLIVPQILSFVFGASSFLATNSQFVVGAIVNTCLIIAGINAKGLKKMLCVVFLPSISALLSGCVLHISAIYTVYMIPFIWIGNFLLLILFKYLFVHKNINYIITSVCAILAKCAVIFAGYNIFVYANVIPQNSKVAQVLFTSMGINQIITAVLGSIIAFGLIKLVYPRLQKKN